MSSKGTLQMNSHYVFSKPGHRRALGLPGKMLGLWTSAHTHVPALLPIPAACHCRLWEAAGMARHGETQTELYDASFIPGPTSPSAGRCGTNQERESRCVSLFLNFSVFQIIKYLWKALVLTQANLSIL